ncbi:DUF6308 family protein [Mycobacterium helveticum]|uniref:DUF6308 family protein n=1 Tax=Mycobacterium helveticum TaxID=2592811 RepID=UPI003CCC4D4F
MHTLRADDFDAWLDAGSRGEAPYELLPHKISLPRVATHKLLARKRLQLFPIRDSVVENALGLSGQQDPWWRPWWAALSSDDALVAHLHDIRQLSGTPHLSLLRVAAVSASGRRSAHASPRRRCARRSAPAAGADGHRRGPPRPKSA